eukprot:Platyproteum_vivax@DN10839_c0_g1_i1.p1
MLKKINEEKTSSLIRLRNDLKKAEKHLSNKEEELRLAVKNAKNALKSAKQNYYKAATVLFDDGVSKIQEVNKKIEDYEKISEAKALTNPRWNNSIKTAEENKYEQFSIKNSHYKGQDKKNLQQYLDNQTKGGEGVPHRTYGYDPEVRAQQKKEQKRRS